MDKNNELAKVLAYTIRALPNNTISPQMREVLLDKIDKIMGGRDGKDNQTA